MGDTYGAGERDPAVERITALALRGPSVRDAMEDHDSLEFFRT
jgi:hypothetical protein